MLLERDRLEDTAETRPGVPQGAQPHSGFAGLHTPLREKLPALTWLWTAVARGDLQVEVNTYALQELPVAWRMQAVSPHAKCVITPRRRRTSHSTPTTQRSESLMTTAEKPDTATDVATGVFAGPIRGLRFATPTLSGVTN